MTRNDESELTLHVDGLACRRGSRLLFKDLSFTLMSGHFLAITGRNGIGKSSLLRLLCGFLQAEAGSVSLSAADSSLHDLPDFVHYLGHRNALKPALSVYENLDFWRRFSDAPGLAPEAALRAVQLEALSNLPAGVLSAGQSRRVAFARLLVSRRPLWLLDEPTAALDKASDQLIGKLISDHVNDGGFVIAATHLPLTLQIEDERRASFDLGDYAANTAPLSPGVFG
ncbi:MAG: heme ABC exporter ATP-binding protein CcmA [Pseudomonadota bacterium]